MAKVTSKLQVTIPKSLAREYRLKPGDDIEWSGGADAIHITRSGEQPSTDSIAARLKHFDQATSRQKARQKTVPKRSGGRGWTREDLYRRGRSR